MGAEWSDSWEADFAAARRRRFLALLSASFAFHLLVMAALVLVPKSSRPALPPVISIDLVSLPAPPAAARARPAPPPRPVVPKKILLPKKPPALREKPRKVKPVLRKPRPKEMEYGDAMAQLRSELGETAPEPAPREVEQPGPSASEAEPAAAGGSLVSKEVLAWVIDTRRHVRSKYITPQEFLDHSLETHLRVVLAASGEVIGVPEVVRSSGDPFWDDNAVRAILSASPLPAPPEAGAWPFSFPSQDRR